MKKEQPRNDRRRDRDGPAPRAERAGAPGRERRSAYRVADDQGSGHGSMSALAKLKMIERYRRMTRPRDDWD